MRANPEPDYGVFVFVHYAYRSPANPNADRVDVLGPPHGLEFKTGMLWIRFPQRVILVRGTFHPFGKTTEVLDEIG